MGCDKETCLNFVVGHSHEARPLIDYYRLRKDKQHTGFNVFTNNQTRLIISGQGKIYAAAATAYLGGVCALTAFSGLWVNVGVAGHPDHSLGSLWRANKVTDEFSGRSFYPVALHRLKKNPVHVHEHIKGCGLMTVDLPASTYSQGCLYDMEASGFFQTAIRFATLESIVSFKVVSDNIQNPLAAIDKRAMANLIYPHIGAIDQYLQDIYLLTNINKDRQQIDIKHIKLTFSQKEIINELIASLDIHGSNYRSELRQAKDARQLIDLLKDKLKRVELLV